MTTSMSHVHPAAWLLAAALVSCAGEKKAAPPPPAPKPTAAEQSQKALQLAAQEQAALNEQLKKAEAARAAVTAAQEQLVRAQTQEQQERAKAQQLQEQARQHLQEGVRQAQQAQTGLSGTGGSEGMQTVTGMVADATPSQLVVQTQGGRAMTFHIDSRTQVLVGTEQRSVADIQRGADAQVAYDPRAGQMTALIIRVMPAGAAGGGAKSPPQRTDKPAHP